MIKPPLDLTLLDVIMRTQSSSRNEGVMRKMLRRMARKIEGVTVEQDDTGNIYLTKGIADIYPTITAHMDTVHSIIPIDDFKIIKSNHNWAGFNVATMKPSGIGGDDKVGIFIAMQMLIEAPILKVCFFIGEEIGCVGSRTADMTFFENAAFVIECDRKGYDDVVSKISGTELFGDEFRDALTPIMKKYDKSEYKWGGLTDVAELKERGLDVACTNISCGYHRPHGADEFINLSEIRYTLDFVRTITTTLGHKRWLHEFIKPTYSRPANGYVSEYRGGLSQTHANWYKPADQKTHDNEVYTSSIYKPEVVVDGLNWDGDDPCPCCQETTLEWAYSLKGYYCTKCKLDLSTAIGIAELDNELIESAARDAILTKQNILQEEIDDLWASGTISEDDALRMQYELESDDEYPREDGVLKLVDPLAVGCHSGCTESCINECARGDLIAGSIESGLRLIS